MSEPLTPSQLARERRAYKRRMERQRRREAKAEAKRAAERPRRPTEYELRILTRSERARFEDDLYKPAREWIAETRKVG